jgi:hypothetical protein
MVAKQPEDLFLGPASHFRPGHRDGSNRFEGEWGESKEIRRIARRPMLYEVATRPDERFSLERPLGMR